MSEKLPQKILVGGFIYNLRFTDFPDEGNYNIGYTNDQKWPKKKVFMQFSESSRATCIKKAWEYLFLNDAKWSEVSHE